MKGSGRRIVADAESTLRLAPTYLALGVLKHVVPLSTLARWVWIGGSPGPTDPAVRQRTVRAVGRLQRWFGRGRDCLQSSLVLYRELSRQGDDPMLCVGFRKEGRTLEGHAWVSAQGCPVMNEAYPEPFVTVVAFGTEGRQLEADRR
jgi:hypothetical protein